MKNYTPGTEHGFPASAVVHQWANVVGQVECGENVRIDSFVTITGRVKIGANVHIGTGVSIFGGAGVEIGDDSSISPGAMIFTASFDRTTGHRANPQLSDKVYASGPVRIGARCIVGAGSVVLPKAVLADDVLIGALSLVKGELSSGLYAGTPVRKI